MDDVVLNKSQIIHRCIQRINQEYASNPDNLYNFTKQDSIILNLQRACEASIDLAMHVVAEKNLGLPQSSRQSFELLFQNGIIGKEIADRLKAMVGFRNIAVHDYQSLNLNILQKIIELHLNDFLDFSRTINKYVRADEKN
ncbi:type II toxin-antitoxin system toxin [Desulfotomaculum defluvii]